MWSFVALIGLFCTLVLVGFTLLSLFTIRRKGSLKNGGISLLLSAVLFAVFIFGVVKTQQNMQVTGHAESDRLKKSTQHPVSHPPASTSQLGSPVKSK
ncbi:hypothetical protein PP175_15400 [Aneurinibacillus sp. Ricciae_BoGa-3]|uniref:hypothetical protein n=1 Tax=Aneurinibacillus sp. Ricciae_BoGa-3 TaxID=3022697 RepID=UPI002341C3DE|nr:hypothetical protein [Aneurinibacillus sp. Ricciae_BoGa-3]WCK52806.1 hypothetical protein PP175_15400 [Aneurinibacillus sp. Ricciae_BoGa-3]